jgi:prepilin-type N-terminal cleavage/methylation domain-containing protein
MPDREHRILTPSPAARRSAFTLPELLVVVGVMAILTLIAVGAFRSLTGSKSVESANNQLAGILGRARGEAIALQETRGIAFFLDSDTQRVQVIEVHQSQYPSSPPANPAEIYLDAVADRDVLLLPDGVGIQMIDDSIVVDPGTPPNYPYDDVRQNDAYIGFNKAPPGFNRASPTADSFTFGGAILFDSYGRVIQKRFGFKFYLETSGGGRIYSELSKTLGMDAVETALKDFPNGGTINMISQFGFVAFNSEDYAGQITAGGTLKDLYTDPQVIGAGAPYNAAQAETGISELAEEKWLDDNAVPQLVNRNNGTLVRGE